MCLATFALAVSVAGNGYVQRSDSQPTEYLTQDVALSEAITFKRAPSRGHFALLSVLFQFCSTAKSFQELFFPAMAYGKDVIGAENALLGVLLKRHFKPHVSAGFLTSLATLLSLTNYEFCFQRPIINPPPQHKLGFHCCFPLLDRGSSHPCRVDRPKLGQQHQKDMHSMGEKEV